MYLLTITDIIFTPIRTYTEDDGREGGAEWMEGFR